MHACFSGAAYRVDLFEYRRRVKSMLIFMYKIMMLWKSHGAKEPKEDRRRSARTDSRCLAGGKCELLIIMEMRRNS